MEVHFTVQKNGYSVDEVDRYIKKISDEYQVTYDENQSLSARYDALLRDYQALERENRTKITEELEAGAGIVSRAILDAEIMAQKIISGAHEEATKIILKANNVDIRG